MDKCRAYKNKTTKIQCSAKIKSGLFCGKHQSSIAPIYNDKGDLILSAINKLSEEHPPGASCNASNASTAKNASNDKLITYKKIAGSDIYSNYLNTRRLYTKDTGSNANKPIEIVEYLENSKIDFYPYSRILATLEYYKLVNRNDLGTTKSKFVLVSNNIAKLEGLMTILIKANTHLDKLVKLQKWIKTRLIEYSKKLHGPARERAPPVNDSDFVSLDDIKDIPDEDFIALEDAKGFVYGFNLESVVDLILKSDENFLETFKKQSDRLCYRQYIHTLYNHYCKIKINNPYTRDLLPCEFKLRVFQLYARKIFTKLADVNRHIQPGIITGVGQGHGHGQADIKQRVRNKCFSIFQKIDMFGYMTDIAWLMDENVKNMKFFYKRLALQWNLEFGLNNTARYRIARTHNLFSNSHLQEIMLSRADKYVLLDKILDTMNILVSNGESEGDRNTGSILILYALAAINPRCIEANPWLG
jgi:hypothetical protein